jgi:hypothetical protein
MSDNNFERFVGHPHSLLKKDLEFDPGKEQEVSHAGFRLEQRKFGADPEGVFRILVTHAETNFSTEVYPSKGFCVGETILTGRPLFWIVQRTYLQDPENIDWSAEIMIQGKKREGFTVVQTLMGGIELYGLQNWGMPNWDSQGKIAPLHGEVSVIPAEKIEITVSDKGFEIKGTFTYCNGNGGQTDNWYNRGIPLYKVEKNIFYSLQETTKIYFLDQITNVNSLVLKPDWGYHVFLRTEKGSRYLIPSREIQNRNSGHQVSDDFELWTPGKSTKARDERGTIHKKALIHPEILGGMDGIKTLLVYPGNMGISFTIPPTPYLQDWFSAGGGPESEDMLIANPSTKDAQNTTNPKFISVYEKPWDGVGPEFGSSALDHDNNIDSCVKIKEQLKPGETLDIGMTAQVLNREQTEVLKKEIEDFNKSRVEHIPENLKHLNFNKN